MKKLLLLLLLQPGWVFANMNDDSTYVRGRIYVGAEILQNVVPLIIPKQFPVHQTYTIEPTILVRNAKGRLVTLTAGFAKGQITYPARFTTAQSHQGVYVKGSFEAPIRKSPVSLGWGPVISLTTFKGRYHFKGETFGDYSDNYTEKDVLSAGVIGLITARANLNKNMLMRFVLHSSFSIGTAQSYFVPGPAYSANSGDMLISGGASCQLMFRVN